MASSVAVRVLAISGRCPARVSYYALLTPSRHYSGLLCLVSHKYSREERPLAVANFSSGFPRNSITPFRRINCSSSNDYTLKATCSTKASKERTLFQRFKDDLALYWYLMLPIHISTSFGYFLCFYYLSKVGISPVPLMDYIGVPAQYVDPLRDSTASHIAVGYAGYKLITPFRYITTIAVTGVTVRWLSSRGILKSMPTFGEFKETVKQKFKSMRR